MNFLKSHRGLFRGLTSVFAVLFCLILVVTVYATGTYRSKVDEILGTNSGSVERSGDADDYRYQSDYENTTELVNAEKEFNERAEEEGAVLLKGTAEDLKVGGDLNVTLFGIRSYASKMQYNSVIGGTANSNWTVGIKDALEDRGFSVNSTVYEYYRSLRNSYTTTSFTAVNEVPVSELASLSSSDYSGYQDAAIIVLGRPASEGSTFLPGEDGISDASEFSESPTGNILGLSDDERDLVEYAEDLGFDKVIVLLNTSSTMEIEELKQDDGVDSILLMGHPSCYGTYGIADLLKGDALPSGHLPDTYAVNTAKSAAAQNYGSYGYSNYAGDSYTTYVAESEDIYTGYKYYETRYYDTVFGNGNASTASKGETYNGTDTVWDYDNEVSYSFGYGVEASEFTEEITDYDIDFTGETKSTVTVKVTNTGDTAAKHVVQLYVQSPYTTYDKENGIEKSAVQLAAYGKTGEQYETDFTKTVLLAAGETEEITLTFNAKDISSYDSSYSHDSTQGAYLLEAGDYYFATGNGAHDAVQAVIKAQDGTKLTDVEPTGDVIKVNLADEDAVAFTEGANGTLIENRLEDMDFTFSEYGTAFTSQGAQYLTRTDWAGTFPETVTGVTANEYMSYYLENETYDSETANASYDGVTYTDDDYGQDTGYTVLDIMGVTDYDDEAFENVMNCIPRSYYSSYAAGNNAAITEIYLDHGNAADSPCGLIVGYGNYTASIPLFADAGDYKGEAPAVFVGEPVLAATFSHELADAMGSLVGNDTLWTGAYWWFGPGLNLHRTPYNARNNEYYSEDAVLTGCMAADTTAAAQAKGAVVCGKHFAYNDTEDNREGIGPFTTEQAARENELRGFEIAFRDGGMKSVMTGFNRIGVTYSSAHSGLITGILRGEWGHNGLVITDSVKNKSYERAAECLVAGTDFMLGGSGDTTGYWASISETSAASDAVLTAAMREAMHHYLYTFADSALIDGYSEELSISASPWWETALVALSWVTGALTAVLAAGWTASYILGKNRKEDGKDE